MYCRFCTRSYAVGVDTDEVEKVSLKATEDRWEQAFQYISERAELEDIVVSGGDSYQLKARQITLLGNKLLEHAEHPAHPLRDQGSGGDADEAHHRSPSGSTR